MAEAEVKLDLAESKKVLAKATRGPWMPMTNVGRGSSPAVYAMGKPVHISMNRTEDAKFVAHFDPPYVAQMIQHIEQLEYNQGGKALEKIGEIRFILHHALSGPVDEAIALLEAKQTTNPLFAALFGLVQEICLSDAHQERLRQQSKPFTQEAPVAAWTGEKQKQLDILDSALSEEDASHAVVMGED